MGILTVICIGIIIGGLIFYLINSKESDSAITLEGMDIDRNGMLNQIIASVSKSTGQDPPEIAAELHESGRLISEFEKMDDFNKLIFELHTPIYGEYRPFKSGDGATSLAHAGERIAKMIDELVKKGDTQAVEPLIELAEKRFPHTPEGLSAGTCKVWPFANADWAIKALGNFDTKKSIDYLVKALEDKDRDIRTTAAKALDKLGWNPDD